MKSDPANLDEPDRIPSQPHPRESYELFGQDEALSRAARAIRGGRPPHGLLLAGEPGIGKATLAYRIARYLLRYGASGDGPADLFVTPNDPVSRQMEAQAHPGLLVLKRPWDEKTRKFKNFVTVDEIRKLGEFFGLKSTSGGWRVALVDSADEMNANAANALLKNLEEPPARALLILISHAPGQLLPTIRSRVRRLDMKPLPENLLVEMLARMAPDVGEDERNLLARLSEGSLGLALKLASDEGAQFAEAAEHLLASGSPDWNAMLKLAERIGRRPDNLEAFGDFLLRAVSRRIRARAEAGRGDERAVELREQLNGLFSRAAGLNLEPRQTVLAAAGLIATAHRQHVL